MPTLFKNIFFWYFLLLAISFAKIKVGYLQSSNGEPISYAVITDSSKSNWTVSDQNGLFSHNFNTVIGDTLFIKRLGYKSSFFIVSQNYSQTYIMQSETLTLASVTVEESFYPFDLPEKTIIINKSQPGYLPGYLPGLGLNSYGGRAGNQSLIFDGGQPVHTKILFENIPITDPQLGITDLTLIPETLIHQITLFPTSGVYFGSGAIDGAINLNSSSSYDNQIKISAGDFGYRQTHLKLSFVDAPFKLSLNTGIMKDNGNYLIDSHNGPIKKENNDFKQTFGMIKSEFHIGQQAQISALALKTISARGIAGSESSPSHFARRNDDLILGKLSAVYLKNDGHLGITLSQFKNIQTYKDGNPDWPIDSEHKPQTKTIHLNLVQRYYPNFLSQTLLELKEESIMSTDVGDHIRSFQSLITRGLWKVSEKIKLTPTIRIDISPGDHEHWTGDLRYTFQKTNNEHIRISGGTAFREPTLNDLFWPEGVYEKGNINLEGEQTQMVSLDWTKSLSQIGIFQLRVTNRLTKNLIQWAEVESGIWSPENIASAKRLSIVLSGEHSSNWFPGTFGWNANFFKTRDIQTKKPLNHIPFFQSSVNTVITLNKISINGLVYYCGKRPYASIEYNENLGFLDIDKHMGAFIRFDLNIGYILSNFNSNLKLEFVINNIFNEDIRSLPDYSEPGRYWSISINYNPINLFSAI